MPHSSKACRITSVSEWSVNQRCAADALELAPELGVVVDLAVEDEPERAVLVRHRLVCPIGKIDDLEPAKASPMRPSSAIQRPSPSGPRWTIASRIRSR